MTRLLRLLLVAAVAALAPALAACGGSDDPGPATVEDTTQTTTPPPGTSSSPTTTPPPGTSGSPTTLPPPPTSTGGDAPAAERMRSVLLTQADVGGEWESVLPSDNTGRLCGLEPIDAQALAEERVEYQSQSQRARLEQVVYAYPDGVAEQVMAAFSQALPGCEDTAAGPPETRFQLEGLPTPALGDEALAVGGDVTQGTTSIRIRATFVRRSSLITVVSWTGFADPPAAFLDPLLTTVDQRLFMLGGA